MNIIFLSTFFLSRRKYSRHKCRFYAVFGQLLHESGQFECWDGDAKRKGAWRMMETRKVGLLCV